ncbi:RCC1 repeat-containing protein, partial [Myxococcota bacterium]|nr:RCC1 repeat-containing protein [Myxococcota bacterium]
ISAGNIHTCARLSTGEARCWGYNGTGSLGDGTTTQRNTPVAVSGIASATSITAGYRHSCARLATGDLRCWGYNGYGNLGDNTTTQRTSPVTVTGF